MNGGQLFFYVSGSSTKQNTYNSSSGSVANTNPLILDSAGRLQAEVWLTTGVTYKAVLTTSGDTDPPASPIWSEDNIAGINDASLTLDQWVTGPAPTYTSSTTFTLVGDQRTTFEVGRALKFTVTAGTVYAKIKTSAYGALTTVTVDAAVLDSGLSAVYSSLISATNNALPALPQAGISSNTVLADADFPSTKNVTATATLTLPVAARVSKGRPIRIKSSTTGSVLVAPNGTDTIDGVNASIRIPSYECVEIESDGTSAWLLTRKSQWAVGDWKWGGYSTADIGWVKGGQDVSRTTYAGVFAIYSTTFGIGDNTTTFGLPDHRGRGLIGAGTGTDTDSGSNADVDTSADTLTVPTNNTKWITGKAVTFTLASGTITGLANGTYYVVRASATTVKLASTLANAQNGTVVDMTAKSSPVWSITNTLTTITLAEKGGEETHAMSITELLAHTHPENMMTGGSGFGGSNQFNATPTQVGVTSSTGGNVAANIRTPFLAGELYIKT